mgnify:CR=1 FL=1
MPAYPELNIVIKVVYHDVDSYQSLLNVMNKL